MSQAGEYLEFLININVTPVEVLETYQIRSHVRKENYATITFANPLSQDAVIESMECKEATVFANDLPLTIPPGVERHLKVFYRPVLVGVSETDLRFSSAELGEFLYRLELSSNPVGPEKTLRFNANLGDVDVQTFRFQCYNHEPVEYSIEIDGEEFSLENNTLKVTPDPNSHDGTACSIDVRYSPSDVGEIRNTLRVTSADGGTYECILFGNSKPPKPQGPFEIKSGASISVSFVNAFQDPETFEVMLSNPNFSVGKNEITLKPKESTTISVSFKPTDNVGVCMDKLVVSCKKTQWLYYLKGIC